MSSITCLLHCHRNNSFDAPTYAMHFS